MKKYIDIIIVIITLLIETGIIIYALNTDFSNIINISLVIIAIIGFGSAYIINKKHSIYSGKFKKHFGE